MDKISNIIPASQRVTAVDLQNSMPIRPGTPQFGRPYGMSSLTDRFTRSEGEGIHTGYQALSMHNQIRNQAEADKVSIADRITADFFMRNDKPVNGRKNNDENGDELSYEWQEPETKEQIRLTAKEIPESYVLVKSESPADQTANYAVIA